MKIAVCDDDKRDIARIKKLVKAYVAKQQPTTAASGSRGS